MSKLRMTLRQLRRRRAATSDRSTFREFVYLDEVSVYSLIASRLGPIAAEFTDTQTATLREDVTGTGGVTVGVAHTELGSVMSSGHTRTSQVLRKSTIQAAFKELYDLAKLQLVLKVVRSETKVAEYASLSALQAAWSALEIAGWVVDPQKLERGDLFEVEIELSADAIYHVSTVASSLLDLVKEQPTLFGVANSDDLIQLEAMSRLLEKLLVGLVPVRARSLHYRVASLNGREWIIHMGLIGSDELADALKLRDLEVVGVLQDSLFWKDVRRVLFAGSRFYGLCRLGESGLRSSWTPVKLAHVLDSILPDLSRMLQNAGTTALLSMRSATTAQKPKPAQETLHLRSLEHYVSIVAQECGHDLSPDSVSSYVMRLSAEDRVASTFRNQRQAFRNVSAILESDLGIEVSRSDAASYRTEARLMAGLGNNHGLVLANPADSGRVTEASVGDPETLACLDSEFVAIYW